MQRRLNILILGQRYPYFLDRVIGQHIGWQQYRSGWYKELFVEEMARQHNVTYYGKGYTENFNKNLELKDIIEQMKPIVFDLIVVMMGEDIIPGFNKVQNILKISISGDIYNGGFRMPKIRKHYVIHHYDVLFGYSSLITYWAHRWQYADHFRVLPFSVDINLHQNLYIPKRYDVMAVFSSSAKEKRSPMRHQIKQLVKQMPVTSYFNKQWFMEHVVKINQARICLNHLWQGFFNPRYFEVLACQGFLLTDCPKYDLELTGFVPGKHFAVFDTLDDLREKIVYWLAHPKYRKRIARQGMQLVRKRHSTRVRVREFTQQVETFL